MARTSGTRKPNRKRANDHFEFTVYAEISTISPAVHVVMARVNDMDCAAGKSFEIEMALREALANAILHGCKSDPTMKIECSVTGDTRKGILIVVRDPGAGFDPSSVPSPTEQENIFSDHGRGIYLIQALMDEVEHVRNGSEIRMRKF